MTTPEEASPEEKRREAARLLGARGGRKRMQGLTKRELRELSRKGHEGKLRKAKEREGK